MPVFISVNMASKRKSEDSEDFSASHEIQRQKIVKNSLQKCLSCVEARDEALRKGKAVATFISAVKHRKDHVYKRLSEEL